MSVQDAVTATLYKLDRSLEGEKIIVAVSGGVDSLVLLKVLNELRETFGYSLHVVTFDHMLRGEVGQADADYVKSFAEKLGLPVTMGQADVSALSESGRMSIETAARQARYTFLVQTAVKLEAEIIAVGHHRDDQVETVLMHMLRGTGLAGLRGMMIESPLSETHLLDDADEDLFDALYDMVVIRPMLEIPRATIRAFAAEHQLEPREDSTNHDLKMLRNRLRHEVLPLLEDINPGIRESMFRMSQIAQGDYQIVQGVVDQIISQIVEWDDTLNGNEIAHVDRSAFLKYNLGTQRQVLRRIVTDLTGEQDIAFLQVEKACDLILNGQTGQQLSLPTDLLLTIGYDEFMFHDEDDLVPYPRHLPHLLPGQVVPLGLDGQGYLTDTLRLYFYWVIDGRSKELYRDDPLEVMLAIPSDAEIALRTRQDGDRFHPMGMDGKSQKLSDVFTNLKVPKPLRDRVPLLTVNDEIAWFVAPTASGLQGRIAEQFAVKPDSDSILRLRWEILK